MNPKNIFDVIGNGDANEDNNFGFIGWDPDNKYKYYSRRYSNFSIITKVEVVSGKSIISQIDLISVETARGVSVKDSYDKLIKEYGTQYNKTIHDDKTTYIYEFINKKLIFDVNKENEIIRISILYID